MLHTRFTEDQADRIRKRSRRVGVPMSKYIHEAVLAKLTADEEADRREEEYQQRRRRGRPRSLGLGLDRHDIQPPVASIPPVAAAAATSDLTTPRALNNARLAKHVLEARDEGERKRRFAAVTEILFAAAETPDKADADVAAVYAVVRNALGRGVDINRSA